VRKRWWWSELL